MATYSVNVPARAGWRRPSGVIVPNRASWQAGTRRWFSVQNGAVIDSRGGRLAPIQISASPAVTDLSGALPEMGLVARTEMSAVPVHRAFTSPSPCPLDDLTAVTLAYWIYPLQVVSGSSYWGQGTGNSCFCECSGASVGPYWRGGSDLRGSFTEVATTGSWQHLAWVANATSTSYYRNGRLAQTIASGCGTITAAGAGESFYLGGQPSGSGGAAVAFDAFWADFRVYRFAATAAQIWSLYDPATRWDLYQVPGRMVSFNVGGGPPPPTVNRRRRVILGAAA